MKIDIHSEAYRNDAPKDMNSNWMVFKDDQLFLVSHKTNIGSVLDRLPRDSSHYDLIPVGEYFVNIGRRNPVDAEGEMSLTFHNTPKNFDVEKYLKNNFGESNTKRECDRFIIDSSISRVVEDVKSKLSDEEFQLLVEGLKSGLYK